MGMKKKMGIAILVVIAAAILFVPIRVQAQDGGTVQYTALTYKVVSWKRLLDLPNLPNDDGTIDQTGRYERTRFYLFPNNFKSLDELWSEEIADGIDYDYVNWDA